MGLFFRLHKLHGIKQRLRKYERFISVIKPTPEDAILDIGATDKEVFEYQNLLETKYPYPQKITALVVEDLSKFKEKYPEVKTAKYDGKKFPFEDNSFDIAFSNAVLEHVGNLEEQAFFLSEVARVCKCGMITTPNRYFPIETHTHVLFGGYLPRRFFYALLRIFKGHEHEPGKTQFDSIRLLSRREFRRVFNMAGINKVEITRDRFLCFTATFTAFFESE